VIHDEAAFRFLGGRLSIDFTATVGMRWRDPSVERIPGPAELARWFVAAGLTDVAVAVPPATLRHAKDLREALYRLMRGRVMAAAPSPADVAVVNRWAAKAPLAPQLQITRRRLTSRLAEPTATGLFAMVARDAVDLLGSPDAARLRECASDTCSLLYLDTSRAGSRRWCSMEACGSRDKMARYRRRAA
jgi:predicted RNA-binding Zn ribbon-like protein